MSILRRLAPASLTAVAVLALGPGAATASTPPTDPPPADAPGETPADSAAGDEPVVVESWALAPTGSLDGDEAGNRPDLSYEVDPGATIDDSVTVFNYGNVQLTFRVYATDAFNNVDGQFDLLPGREAPVDAGSWVRVAQENVTVPPGKQVTIPITITIPEDAAPGDHAGAVVASNIATSTNNAGQAVDLDRRTGTRMYIRVSGPLQPELAISGLDTSYHHAANPLGGSADVSFTVENRGNVRLSGVPSVSVAGPLGLGRDTVTLPEVTELLPGQQVTVRATLSGVPALFLDTTTVDIEPSGADGVTVTRAERLTFAPPLSVLLALLALLCGLMAWRAYGRHRRSEAPDGPDDSDDTVTGAHTDVTPELEHAPT